MSERRHYEIAVIGGGIAGQVAAIAFAQSGRKTLCVDPSPDLAPNSDLRSTAFLQPARRLLAQIGVWQALAPHATPLQTMRLLDRGMGEGRLKVFDAGEISDLPFAWNLPNTVIRRELAARMKDQPRLTALVATSLTGLLTRTKGAVVRLSSGQQITADLVVAADGRFSTVREASGIGVNTTEFDQMALAFAVAHETPHENSSTEIHRAGGPFTLVPLPDENGQHRSAVVWMETAAKAQDLMGLREKPFNHAMNDRAGDILGQLTLVGGRSIWPMMAQIADRFTAPGVALVAEAAHVVPPIGAQGLNMSLGDIEALLELADQHPLGSEAMLKAYENQRYTETKRRIDGVTMLNHASISGRPILQAARALGLDFLHGVKPIRHGLMRMGLRTGGG